MKKAKTAEVSLLITTAIWGSTFLIIKLMVTSDIAVKPYTLLFLRFGIATLAALLILRPFRIPTRDEIKGGVIIGIAAWTGYTFQTLGLLHTTPAKSGFITSLFVVFVPFVSRVWERERIAKRILFALVPSIMGLWAISGVGLDITRINPGDRLTLLSAISYAFQVVGIQVYTKRVDWKMLTIFQFGIIMVGSVPLMLRERPDFVLAPEIWGGLLYLGIVASVGALGVQMYAQRFTTSNRASMIYISEPIFAAIFAWIVGGQSMSKMEIAGSLLILLAMFVARENTCS